MFIHYLAGLLEREYNSGGSISGVVTWKGWPTRGEGIRVPAGGGVALRHVGPLGMVSHEDPARTKERAKQ